MNIDVLNNMRRKNANLSVFACKDEEALYFNKNSNDFRTQFYKDIDKILYSLSYIRYIDKTQVFSNVKNDMISKRMTHVQMVSRIARTIGRALNLNEDLIEAASLGHDLGHAPFGHVGESILNKISLNNKEGFFNHNVQSVRTLLTLENNGKGSNISIQVLDAILCHNGEIIKGKYSPEKKDKEKFIYEYKNSYFDKEILKKIKPMTLEGCVVRISDIIAYVGRDIDDAIRMNLIKRKDIPDEITNVLGNSNSKIIDTIVKDIINNSINNNYITMSEEIFNALNKLIKFNYENIYNNVNSKEKINEYENMFNELFNIYYKALTNKETNNDIYLLFLNNMCNDYINNSSKSRIVIDYIAGMTDDFFIDQYDKYCNY